MPRNVCFPAGSFSPWLRLAATVVILLVTRIPDLGLRQLLTATEPNWALELGRLGTFSVSPSLVVALAQHPWPGFSHWNHAILYVPSLIPFVLTAGFAFALFRSSPNLWGAALAGNRRPRRQADRGVARRAGLRQPAHDGRGSLLDTDSGLQIGWRFPAMPGNILRRFWARWGASSPARRRISNLTFGQVSGLRSRRTIPEWNPPSSCLLNVPDCRDGKHCLHSQHRFRLRRAVAFGSGGTHPERCSACRRDLRVILVLAALFL